MKTYFHKFSQASTVLPPKFQAWFSRTETENNPLEAAIFLGRPLFGGSSGVGASIEITAFSLSIETLSSRLPILILKYLDFFSNTLKGPL